jgi:hypothetical protein
MDNISIVDQFVLMRQIESPDTGNSLLPAKNILA